MPGTNCKLASNRYGKSRVRVMRVTRHESHHDLDEWTVQVLLTGDFIVLVLISCIVASPIAFYFLQHWLQNYDYRITIGPWVFIAAAMAAVIITIVTISFQAIKAAIANPVISLRSE